MSAPLCPIHDRPARFRESSAHLYMGRDYGPIWECPEPQCDATVGCHPDGSPLGALATKTLKRLRMAAHDKFDALWKPWEAQQLAYPEETRVIGKLRGAMRSRAYAWLAEQMDITREACHIGHMDEVAAKRAIEIIEREKPTAATVRAWAKQNKNTTTAEHA